MALGRLSHPMSKRCWCSVSWEAALKDCFAANSIYIYFFPCCNFFRILIFEISGPVWGLMMGSCDHPQIIFSLVWGCAMKGRGQSEWEGTQT